MNAARLIVAIGVCCSTLAGVSGCGRRSPTTEQKRLVEDEAGIVEVAKALDQIESAIPRYEERLRAMEDDPNLLRTGTGTMPRITPDWINIERGMKVDELESRQHGPLDAAGIETRVEWMPGVPSRITPQWLQIERGMKADELDSRQPGLRMSPRR
jgi:hypothetical protein